MSEVTSYLDSLGLEFATDKSSWGHDYLRFYEDYLKRFKDQNVKVLEIGVAGGGSLRVWEKYFQNGTIIGVDINPDVRKFERGRITIEIADQSDIHHLVSLAVKHGPFDIIVEDGSHMWEHQTLTLQTLFPFLKEDGIYIVEDLQTNYGRMRDGYRGVAKISCVEYLKRLLDARVAHSEYNLAAEEDAFVRAYGQRIKSLSFYRESCLIQNGSSSRTEAPFLSSELDVAPGLLRMLPHIGDYGDRRVQGGFVRGRKSQCIQGFEIHASPPLTNDLTYRARHNDGSWSEWAKSGQFVGWRGRGTNLTGYAVKLTGGSERKFQVQTIGEFVGSDKHVVVKDGEDCVSQPLSDLRGMQIVVLPR